LIGPINPHRRFWRLQGFLQRLRGRNVYGKARQKETADKDYSAA
jgi:hypothetical protein